MAIAEIGSLSEEYVYPVGEGADLGRMAHSAQNDGMEYREVPPIGAEALPDLEGELARGRQNEGAQCGSPAISAAARSFAASASGVYGSRPSYSAHDHCESLRLRTL